MILSFKKEIDRPTHTLQYEVVKNLVQTWDDAVRGKQSRDK